MRLGVPPGPAQSPRPSPGSAAPSRLCALGARLAGPPVAGIRRSPRGLRVLGSRAPATSRCARHARHARGLPVPVNCALRGGRGTSLLSRRPHVRGLQAPVLPAEPTASYAALLRRDAPRAPHGFRSLTSYDFQHVITQFSTIPSDLACKQLRHLKAQSSHLLFLWEWSQERPRSSKPPPIVRNPQSSRKLTNEHVTSLSVYLSTK